MQGVIIGWRIFWVTLTASVLLNILIILIVNSFKKLEIDELKAEIRDNTEIWCSGTSLNKVKISAVMYKLLEEFGYELKGEETELKKIKK